MSWRSKKKKGRPAKVVEVPPAEEIYPGSLEGRRRAVLRMRIEKFNEEIRCIDTAKSLLQTQRKNIYEQIEILKLKEEIFAKQIENLEKKIEEKKNNSDDDIVFLNATTEQRMTPYSTPNKARKSKARLFSSPVTGSPNNTIPTKQTNETINESEDRTPYVVLLASNSKSYEKNSLKKFYIKTVLDVNINQCFELINPDPLKIAPIDSDVALKMHHLEQLRPHILEWATVDTSNIPTLSILSKIPTEKCPKNTEVLVSMSRMGSNIVDLTDGNGDDVTVKEEEDLPAKRQKTGYSYKGSQLPHNHYSCFTTVNVSNHLHTN